MKYPIEITEYPHRGQPRTWTLWDDNHLARCIDSHFGKFEEWAEAEGLLKFHEDSEGNITIEELGAYTPEAYIDFLRRDLKKIEVEERE